MEHKGGWICLLFLGIIILALIIYLPQAGLPPLQALVFLGFLGILVFFFIIILIVLIIKTI